MIQNTNKRYEGKSMICMQYLTALKVKPVALTRVRHLAIGYFVSQSVSSYVEISCCLDGIYLCLNIACEDCKAGF